MHGHPGNDPRRTLVKHDTKITIAVRDDLAVWQKLNVVAFLASGIAAHAPDIIGEPYRDADGRRRT